MGKTVLFYTLISTAIILIVMSYFSPIWWVSLKAPNYPPETFPDGVRIHFHTDGVFNGCQIRESSEIQEDEALNCVHEMDTINHYIGMYPIASGGPIEKTLSPFLFAFLIALLLAFMTKNRYGQASILAISFGAIIIWGYVALLTHGGVTLLSPGYQNALSQSLSIEYDEFEMWSGLTAMQNDYQDSLGMYFREPVEIERRTTLLMLITYIIITILIIAMIIMIAGILFFNRIFHWLLLIIPLLLPAFFIMEYAGWLWWFGHNLNEMGAFTIKPFMPTVFGEGKVAQFSTYSYPHYGFGLMVLASLALVIAGVLRRNSE